MLTLFTALILGALVVGFLNLTAIDLNLLWNHIYSQRAYYVAEAGLVDAIDKVQRDKLNTTEWDQNFPENASSTYHVTVVSGPTVVITSTGFVPAANFSRVIEAHVKVVSDKKPYKVAVKHFEEVIP